MWTRSHRLMFGLLWSCALAAAQGGGFANVSGVVVDSQTGQPILRAHVSLMPTRETTQSYGALTDAAGKFAILRVPAGTYLAGAQRTGYLGGFNEPIKLEAGADKSDVKLSVTPGGLISGRVLDMDGEPVEGAMVQALGAGATNTDDRGQYRIANLAAGRYRVSARPQSEPFVNEIRMDGSTPAHYGLTYYPNSIEQRTAGRITVKAGVETSGIDIRLVRTPIVHVRGVVTGFPASVLNATVQVNPPEGENRMGNVRPDGKFDVGDVNPGRYHVYAMWGSGAGQMYTAPVEVEVGQSDVENIELRSIAPFTVSGVIRYDDEQAKPPERGKGIVWSGQPDSMPRPGRQGRPHIMLQNSGAFFGGTPPAEIHEDGSFEFQKVAPGKYQVAVMWPTAFVKSMQLGSTLMDGQTLDVTYGVGGNTLSVLVSSAFAEISGKVDGPAEVVQRSVVVLKSAAQTHYVNINQDGTYGLGLLAPGKYKLGAVGQHEMNPTLELDNAVEVTLSAGEKVTKDLKAAEEQ